MKIFLIGMMGSGKSFLGKQIAGKLQLSMFDLDNLIEAKEKSSIEEIFSKKGEKYFREIETKILRSFSNEESFVLATGGGAACFNNNMEWMNEEGITVWLNETIDIITERLLNEKKQRPLIKNIKDDELKEFLKELLEERNQFYKQAKYSLSGENNLEDFLKMFK